MIRYSRQAGQLGAQSCRSLIGRVLALLLCATWLAVPATAVAQSSSSVTLKTVTNKVKKSNKKAADRIEKREARFKAKLDKSKQRLASAKAKLKREEERGQRLEKEFDDNKVELFEKDALLKTKTGELKELFGVFQQNASDLIGAFISSPTSLQYPDRDKWLEGFANRMKNASEVSSATDIKTLWYEMQREITASNDIVSLRAPVYAPKKNDDEPRVLLGERDIVRIGTFNLISNDPEPSYLVWKPGQQQVVELHRQPTGPYINQIADYVDADEPLTTLSVDPTGGVLLSLLIEKPTPDERLEQGGLVGDMILGLGVLAFVLALLKMLDITVISLMVAVQRRKLDEPSTRNPLGRMILAFDANKQLDSESLELRLHDQLNKETARVNRFTVFLGIIAAVAPLMGLLGTVVGMINTFQAITLYGTGDPQTMAGGISQALITTVLGLIVAVPAVLLHAMVMARGRSVVNVLQQHRAALTGDKISTEHSATPPSPPSSTPPPPSNNDGSGLDDPGLQPTPA